jgi:hypothetical protein
MTKDFVEFITIPMALQKRYIASYILSTMQFEPSQEIIMSSKKYKCEIVHALPIKIPLNVLEILHTSRILFLFSSPKFIWLC